MARLGIDFGTTNTVIVFSDRGRYPVMPHVADTAIGHIIQEVFPSLTIYDRQAKEFLYGLEAERRLTLVNREDRYRVIRSIKRLLRNYYDGFRIGADIRDGGVEVSEILLGFGKALRESMMKSEFFSEDEDLETVITWPANANGAQRYVTRRFFREAGFKVIEALNEPTAAAIEFADRIAKGNRAKARKMSAWVAIFDLGGGTFDASVVRIEGSEFTVANAGGIEELGGDDFDRILARMFAEKMRLNMSDLSPFQQELLIRHSCQQKESISAGYVDALSLNPEDIGLVGKPCMVSVSAFFSELRPLIEQAVEKLWAVATSAFERGVGIDPSQLHSVYLVGGSSRLPLVSRLISERFPHVRVVVSDKPFTATAMGAAIHSAEEMTLHDVFARHFGVIRLAENGSREFFAPIFQAGIQLPARGLGPLEHREEYSPRHNIGYLRYFECAGVDDAGRPAEGVRSWSEILFPYDSQVPVGQKLHVSQIVPRDDLSSERILETYHCDSDGVITVTLTRCRDGQSRSYEVFKNP